MSAKTVYAMIVDGSIDMDDVRSMFPDVAENVLRLLEA